MVMRAGLQGLSVMFPLSLHKQYGKISTLRTFVHITFPSLFQGARPSSFRTCVANAYHEDIEACVTRDRIEVFDEEIDGESSTKDGEKVVSGSKTRKSIFGDGISDPQAS